MALDVHGPIELHEVIELQLRISRTFLRFPLRFHPVANESGTLVFRDERVEVTELALRHRIPSTGYLFREAVLPRRLRKDKVEIIPHYDRERVKAGDDLLLPDGRLLPNSELTIDPPARRSYAYCSDTAFKPDLIPFLEGVDLLYHEATFAEGLIDRAKETLHSTAKQAAKLARDAHVHRLLLGHISSRYKDDRILHDEAIAVFPNTLMAVEGRTFQV